MTKARALPMAILAALLLATAPALAATDDLINGDPYAPEIEYDYDSGGFWYTRWPGAIELPRERHRLPRAIAEILLQKQAIQARSPHLWNRFISHTLPYALFNPLDENFIRNDPAAALAAASDETLLWEVLERGIARILDGRQPLPDGPYRSGGQEGRAAVTGALMGLITAIGDGRERQERQKDMARAYGGIRLQKKVINGMATVAGVAVGAALVTVTGGDHSLVGMPIAYAATGGLLGWFGYVFTVGAQWANERSFHGKLLDEIAERRHKGMRYPPALTAVATRAMAALAANGVLLPSSGALSGARLLFAALFWQDMLPAPGKDTYQSRFTAALHRAVEEAAKKKPPCPENLTTATDLAGAPAAVPDTPTATPAAAPPGKLRQWLSTRKSGR